jgi:hypothetical protein
LQKVSYRENEAMIFSKLKILPRFPTPVPHTKDMAAQRAECCKKTSVVTSVAIKQSGAAR